MVYADIQVISNSPIDKPWQKVSKGHEKFEQIVSRHRHKCTTAELKEDLIGMLSDCSRYGNVNALKYWTKCRLDITPRLTKGKA